MQHTAKVYQTLLPATSETPVEKTQIRQQYFDKLPPDFDRTAIVATAQKLGIPSKSAERYIKQWCDSGQITHVSHGQYSKSK